MSVSYSALAFAQRSRGAPVLALPPRAATAVQRIVHYWPDIPNSHARVLDVLRRSPGLPVTIAAIEAAMQPPALAPKTIRCVLSALNMSLRNAGLAGALFHKHSTPHWILERGAAHLINGHLASTAKDAR